MKIGIILTPDARSKAYVQKIIKNTSIIARGDFQTKINEEQMGGEMKDIAKNINQMNDELSKYRTKLIKTTHWRQTRVLPWREG